MHSGTIKEKTTSQQNDMGAIAECVPQSSHSYPDIYYIYDYCMEDQNSSHVHCLVNTTISMSECPRHISNRALDFFYLNWAGKSIRQSICAVSVNLCLKLDLLINSEVNLIYKVQTQMFGSHIPSNGTQNSSKDFNILFR